MTSKYTSSTESQHTTLHLSENEADALLTLLKHSKAGAQCSALSSLQSRLSSSFTTSSTSEYDYQHIDPGSVSPPPTLATSSLPSTPERESLIDLIQDPAADSPVSTPPGGLVSRASRSASTTASEEDTTRLSSAASAENDTGEDSSNSILNSLKKSIEAANKLLRFNVKDDSRTSASSRYKPVFPTASLSAVSDHRTSIPGDVAAQALPKFQLKMAKTRTPKSRSLPSFADVIVQKRHNNQRVGICISRCHNSTKDIVRDVLEVFPDQIREIPYSDVTKSDVVWTDISKSDVYETLLPHQRVNHFPQMHEIVTKSSFAKLVNTSRSLFSKEFDFVPDTWELPQDRIVCEKTVRAATERSSGKAFILKPTSGLQGREITLANKWEAIRRKLNSEKGMIVQAYVDRPMLLGGLKWDLPMVETGL